MIKHFFIKKIGEKVFTKALQGDRRSLMKYLKIAIAVVILGVFLIIGLIITAVILIVKLLGILVSSL
jgi:hypothetical protein